MWWSSYHSDVGRLEVLKGAGTALYGSGAVAATVNVISKPNSEQPSTQLSVGGGEHGYGKVAVSHSQAIDQQQSFRVSASSLTNDGWRENTSSKRQEISARHEYQLSDDQQLVTSLVLSDLDQQMATNLSLEQFEQDASQSGLPPEVQATDPRRKSQYARLSMQYNLDLNNNEYLSLIPYLRYRDNDYTAVWSANMAKVESSVKTFGLLAMYGLNHSDDSQTTFGLDIEVSDGDQYSYQPVTVVTQGWGADTFLAGEQYYNDTTRYVGVSPYLQHQRTFADNWQLTLGVRYDKASYDFDNHLGVIGDIGHGAQSLADRKDDFSHLSPKASINYQLNGYSSIYGRYANSFRLPTAGSLYHLKNTDSSTLIGAVDPEISDTFEMGYKANFERVTLDVAVYSMDVDDAIVNAWDDSGVRYKANAGKASHVGIEIATDWQVSQSTSLSLSYSKAEHEYDEYVLDANRVDSQGNSRAKDYSGNEMQMSPEYIANLRLRYSPQAIHGLTTMLELQSIGDYWMDDENEQRYQGYTVANFKLNYQLNDNLSINARVVNLTDKYYAQQAYVSYGRGRYAAGAPRMVYLGASYEW